MDDLNWSVLQKRAFWTLKIELIFCDWIPEWETIVFIWIEQTWKILLYPRIYIFSPHHHLRLSQYCFHVTHPEKNWSQHPGYMCTVTGEKMHHPALWTWFFEMWWKSHIFKGLLLKHLRKTSLAQRFFQPLPQWTITTILPARQPAFRFPSKHLSHLWLDPCCLDTYMQSWLGHFQTSKDEVSVVPGNK